MAEGKPDIHIGVGINTAEVVVGNIGSLDHKLDYTVIGDGVNLASRLESANKEFHTGIIVSEFTLAKLGDRFDVRALGDVKVKGKERPVAIYELLGRKAAAATARRRRGGESDENRAWDRVRLALAALLAAGTAAAAEAQKAQWTDVVYVPGRWAGGKLVSRKTTDPRTDSLALVMRVDYFSAPPKWRAEIRRTADGQTMGNPDILDRRRDACRRGDGARRDAAGAARARPGSAGPRGHGVRPERSGAAGRRPGDWWSAPQDGSVGRVVFRRSVKNPSFADALLDPGARSGGRNLLASGIAAVGDQRQASVVATAGARGVDRVKTPGGDVPVTPDSVAIRRMEAFVVGAVSLEDFMRTGGLGPYAVKSDSAGRQP